MSLIFLFSLLQHGRECFFPFVVSVCELRKLGINNQYRPPGNKTDGKHPGRHLRARHNIHTFQTNQTSFNASHTTKNTNNINVTVNSGQAICTQIPKLKPRSPKNCHTTEGIVRLRFCAYIKHQRVECK